MNRGNLGLIRGLGLAISLGLCGLASAELSLSKKFSFQGHMSNLPDGVYEFHVNIDGGTNVYNGNLTNVSVRNGVFTLLMDGATDASLNAGVFSSTTGIANPRVTVDVYQNGNLIDSYPEVPLTAVPNAFVAQKAGEALLAIHALNTTSIAGVTVDVTSLNDRQYLGFDAQSSKFKAFDLPAFVGAPGVQVSASGGNFLIGLSANVVTTNAGSKIPNTLLNVGAGNGDIPVLGSGGVLSTAVIPTIPGNKLPFSLNANNDKIVGTSIDAGAINGGTHIADDTITMTKLAAGVPHAGDVLKISSVTGGTPPTVTGVWGSPFPSGSPGDMFVITTAGAVRLPGPTTNGQVLITVGNAAILSKSTAVPTLDTVGVGLLQGVTLGWIDIKKLDNDTNCSGSNCPSNPGVSAFISQFPSAGPLLSPVAAQSKVDLSGVSSGTPLKISYQDGKDGAGRYLSATVTVSTSLQWTLLTDANVEKINYLFLKVNSNGTFSTVATDIVPVFEGSTPASNPTIQFWFDATNNTWQQGTGTTPPWATRKGYFVGWAIAAKGGNGVVEFGQYNSMPASGGNSMSALGGPGMGPVHGTLSLVPNANTRVRYWAVPNGVSQVAVEGWSGGGGGGAACISKHASGGGGGGYGKALIDVTPGTVLLVVMGKGGSRGARTGGDPCSGTAYSGEDGDPASVGGVVLAGGGAGGGGAWTGSAYYINGGAGASRSLSAGVVLSLGGAPGGSSSVSSSGGGGAGASMGGPATYFSGAGQQGLTSSGTQAPSTSARSEGGTGGFGGVSVVNDGGDGGDGLVLISY